MAEHSGLLSSVFFLYERAILTNLLEMSILKRV